MKPSAIFRKITSSKVAWAVMVAVIALSTVLSFCMRGVREAAKPDISAALGGSIESLGRDFSHAIKLGAEAKELYDLNRMIDRILLQDSLTGDDSLFLMEAIKILDQNEPLRK